MNTTFGIIVVGHSSILPAYVEQNTFSLISFVHFLKSINFNVHTVDC